MPPVPLTRVPFNVAVVLPDPMPGRVWERVTVTVVPVKPQLPVEVVLELHVMCSFAISRVTGIEWVWLTPFALGIKLVPEPLAATEVEYVTVVPNARQGNSSIVATTRIFFAVINPSPRQRYFVAFFKLRRTPS